MANASNTNWSGRPCLIVGNGPEADEAATRLLQVKAKVTLAAPKPCAALQAKSARGLLGHHRGCFHPKLLDGQALVIAATDNPVSNRWIAYHARQRRIPVGIADRSNPVAISIPSLATDLCVAVPADSL